MNKIIKTPPDYYEIELSRVEEIRDILKKKNKITMEVVNMILDNQLIDGNNGIAGEVAYLPLFDFLKKREFDNSLENIIQVVATTIVMYNPHLLILTGENIKEDDLEAIQKGDLNYVPIHFMPSLKYQENCEDYYFQGLESQIIQRIQL